MTDGKKPWVVREKKENGRARWICAKTMIEYGEITLKYRARRQAMDRLRLEIELAELEP